MLIIKTNKNRKAFASEVLLSILERKERSLVISEHNGATTTLA